MTERGSGRALALAGLLVSTAASAQVVSMSGSLGSKALLIIDGTPRTLEVGSSAAGVRLVSVAGDSAVIEVGGRRVALTLGGAQVNLGGRQSEGNGAQIVLTADNAGHFFTGGTINGKSVRFLVDTGATSVALPASEALRLGIDYRKGQRAMSSTAGGMVPIYIVRLDTVRLGPIELSGVEGVVVEQGLDIALLGMSFLNRVEMKRDGQHMVLVRRY